MKTLVNTLALSILISLLAATAYGLYWGGGYLWERLAVIDAPLRVLLLAGSATAILVALILVAGRRSAARHHARGRLAGDRLNLYRELLARDHAAMRGARSTTDHLAGGSLDIELALLATAPVVDAHVKFLQALREPDTSRAALEDGLTNLLREMRRDLGHDDSLTRLWLSDDGTFSEGPAHGLPTPSA